MIFLRFPNQKVWHVEVSPEGGFIRGALLLDNYERLGCPTVRFDNIVEAAFGDVLGVEEFSYVYRGQGRVSFRGLIPTDTKLSDVQELEVGSDELREALCIQYDLLPFEVDHALNSLGLNYGEECRLPICFSYRDTHTPPHPAPCDYVRVVIEGLEIAYWHHDEWHTSPAEVMGAIIGASKGGTLAY